VHPEVDAETTVQRHQEIVDNEAEINARICHISHVEPCQSSLVGGQIGLLFALSIHSFLEGLAIGVQDTGKKVTESYIGLLAQL
jgi:zinc transporter ZupT